MFSVVFTICLLADPQTCDHRPAAIPAQASYSECLHAGRNEAVLFARHNRERRVTEVTCAAAAPGRGR
jgi:hypothetical protein